MHAHFKGKKLQCSILSFTKFTDRLQLIKCGGTPKVLKIPKESRPQRKKAERSRIWKERKQLFLMNGRMADHGFQFDSESPAMFCDYCINAGVYPEKSSFVKGCTNFKKDVIQPLQYGNSHLCSMNKFLHEQSSKDAPAERAKLSLNKSVWEADDIVPHSSGSDC